MVGGGGIRGSVRQLLRYGLPPATPRMGGNQVMPAESILDAPGSLFGLPGNAIARQLRFDLEVSQQNRRKAAAAAAAGGEAASTSSKGEKEEHQALVLTMLADDTLNTAAEECSAAEAVCELLQATPTSSTGVNEEMSSQPTAMQTLAWLEHALSSLIGKQGPGSVPVLLATEPGCEGDAALLAIAALIAESGATMRGGDDVGDVCTTYLAAVHAARWGIDLHLSRRHVEALKMWNRKKQA